MKFLYYLLFTLFLFHYSFAQQSNLGEWLNKETEMIKDTVFHLHSSNGLSADLPVTLIAGKEKGPTFTIIAGIHGMEYPTILSLLELRKEIDPKKLKGNLIIIPIVNTESFYKRTPFVNPLDGLNLNKVFPGSSTGTITGVIADFMTREVFKCTDILLDMHGGDVSEDLIPFMCYYDNKDFAKQTKLATRLSEISGFDTVVSYPYNLPEDKPAMYAFKQAVRQGVTALSIEIGKLGSWQKSEISLAKDAIYRMMREVKMYDNNSVKSVGSAKITYDRQAYVYVPVQGIFYSSVKAGDYVEKGAEIGYITDIFGKNIKTITAPQKGIVLYKIGTPPVNQGETLFCIGFKS